MKREDGLTLIELMISAGLIIIVALGVATSFTYARKSSVTVGAQRQSSDVGMGILQQTTDAFTKYQVNFNDTASMNDSGGVFPMNAPLPIAFSREIYSSAEECPSCPGRMGFVIQPLSGYRGMYRATIRIQNTDSTDKSQRDLNLVIGDME
ncbi:MAG: type II secretion system GspH family protein [Oligoflexia bacterium]|nr:type II secretion system GspH family protein [Oligoflexia bacterium]